MIRTIKYNGSKAKVYIIKIRSGYDNKREYAVCIVYDNNRLHYHSKTRPSKKECLEHLEFALQLNDLIKEEQ